jgi:hypothetical protein
MLAVSSEECRARATECLRHAANDRMPMELRESWLSLTEMWEAWAIEAKDNGLSLTAQPLSHRSE